MSSRFLLVLTGSAVLSLFPVGLHSEGLWTCPNDDPNTPEFETKTVDCDAHTVTVGSSAMDVPAVNCEEVPPSDAEGLFRYNCCCTGLLTAGYLPATPTGRVGGTAGMERDFQFGILPALVDQTPEVLEAVDFTVLMRSATATKETHRLLFQVGLLPADFGDAFGDTAVSIQVRNDRGLNRIGAALLDTPVDARGVRAAALNGFAHKYLGRAGNILALRELGTFTLDGLVPNPARDPAKSYFHVVEHVQSLQGDGSLRSDSFGVVADLRVRVYTVPSVALP